MSSYVRYDYTPLDDGSIRLLELAPGDIYEDLLCSVISVQLQECPPYEAVSYVWGSPEPPAYLDCGKGFVRISTNLATGLRQLRSKDHSRMLWADQVCINQNDVAERSAQVNMMSEIFKRANCVIMWLGSDDKSVPEAPAAAKLIETLASWAGRTPYANTLPTDQTLADYYLPPLASQKWDALRSFVSLPYFSRVWILQEIRLAVRHNMLWGEIDLKWSTVQTAIQFICENQYLFTRLELNHQWMSQIMSISKGAESLLDLVKIARSRQASDPRDMVFAMLGMLEQIPSRLKADYSKSIVEVFTMAARYFMNDSPQNLKFLSYAGTYHYREGLAEASAHWPSWVPMWHAGVIDALSYGWRKFRASGDDVLATPRACSIGSNILSLVGVKVEHISHIGRDNRPLRNISVESSLASIREAWELCFAAGLLPKAKHTEPLIKTVLNTLTCGWYAGKHNGQLDAVAEERLYHDFARYWAITTANDLQDHPPGNIQALRSRLQIADAAFLATTFMESGDQFNLIIPRDELPIAAKAAKDQFLAIHIEHFDEAVDHLMRIIGDAFATEPELWAAIRLLLPFYLLPAQPGQFTKIYGQKGERLRFFVTDSGAIGMGPGTMQPGDLVVILFGASSPFVLRPTDNNGQYSLVGECYLDGIMEGQRIEQLQENGALEKAQEVFHLI